MDQISATLDDTYVNWSGTTVYDTSQGKGIYFQISGPKVYVELASQDNDAGATVSGVQTSGWATSTRSTGIPPMITQAA